MEFITHKRLDLEVSRLAFGGAALSGEAGGYGFGEIGETQAQKLIEHAIDLGINCFDTAPIYGFHTSEIRLGKYLKGKRDKVLLCSKSGITWHSTKRVNLTNDPKVCLQMLEQSLRNLQTSYIDMYFIHWPDPRIDIRYALEVLAQEQAKGKIRFIGLCNPSKEDYLKSSDVCRVDILQAESNIFHHPLQDFSEEIYTDDLLTMGWGTLDKGILSGSVHKERKFAKEDARSWAPWWKKSNWREKVELVKKIETATQTPIMDLALALAQKQTAINICGAKSPKQYDQILQSLNKDIDEKEIHTLLDMKANFED
ncbi:MAG: hypothetical protein CME62_04275 [Halobacteriovoraceae bacterium]|nr:hypothetical protein [Halobacteriovoraceae bacterium]